MTAIVEFRPDGIYLVYLSQSEGILVVSTIEFEPDKPVLFLPGRRSAGQAWSFSMTSKDGKVTVHSNNSIEQTGETISTSAGQARTTDKVRTVSHVTGQSAEGPFDVTTNAAAWYDPSVGFQIKEQSHTDGTMGPGCKVTSDLVALIQKL